jgi:hypothetical protein
MPRFTLQWMFLLLLLLLFLLLLLSCLCPRTSTQAQQASDEASRYAKGRVQDGVPATRKQQHQQQKRQRWQRKL